MAGDDEQGNGNAGNGQERGISRSRNARDVQYQIEGEIKLGSKIKISSKAGGTYGISISPDQQYACSCPGFQFHGSCKHVNYIDDLFEAKSPTDTSFFVVKGKPKINLGDGKDTAANNLKTILMQKVEELREQQKNSQRIYIAHPGSEFKPESIPYIPDSDHPLLSKHDLATPEHNAGFVDASMVPRMYKDSIRPPAKPEEPVISNEKSPSSATVKLEITPADKNEQVNRVESSEKPETKPEINSEIKKPEFTMGVKRADMNKGGFYVPNESRPYRPGD